MNHIVSVNKIVLVVLLLSGCGKVVKKHVPLPDLLQSIADETYILHRNDCSNKCAKYFYAVKAAGYDPTIIVYRLTNGKIHTVVKVKETYIDCTNATSTMMRPKGIMHEVKEEDFYRFKDEYRVR